MNYKYEGEDELHKDKMMELINASINRKVIIELGCGDGEDTAYFLYKLNENDQYFAIEADPRSIERFNRRINDKRVTLINAAITNKNKPSGIFHVCTGINPYFDRPHYDASSLRYPTKETYDEIPWIDYEDIEVPYITLDYIVEKYLLPKVDFIWCDVEGATREVIEGGLEALKITKYFYTEVKDKLAYSYEGEAMYEEIIDLMNEVGFELVQKFNDNALFRNVKLT